jgi:hypothetical protein
MENMKKFRLMIPALAMLFSVILAGCNSNSKAKSWSPEQKEQWTTSCLKFMDERGTPKNQAVDFCDCMLKKTSEKYTPQEAEKITPQEERKLWQECDYQW